MSDMFKTSPRISGTSRKVYLVLSEDDMIAFSNKRKAIKKAREKVNNHFSLAKFKRELINDNRIDWINVYDDVISLYTLEVHK